MINNDNINNDWASLLGGDETVGESTESDKPVETPKTKTKTSKVEKSQDQGILTNDQFTQFANLIAQSINLTNQTNQEILREERRQEQIARENAAKSKAGLASMDFRRRMEKEIEDGNYVSYHYAPVFSSRFGKVHEITISGYTIVFREGEHIPIPRSLYPEVLNRFSGLMAKKVNGNHIFNFQFEKGVSLDEQSKLMETFDSKLTQRR